jgi:hypothetical protein
MDSNEDNTEKCNSENNISDADMQTCLADNDALIDKFLERDSGIGSAPTTKVNGQKVEADYGKIASALCSAKSDLAGCSKAAGLDVVV